MYQKSSTQISFLQPFCLNIGLHIRHSNVTYYEERGKKIPYLEPINWNNNDVQVSMHKKESGWKL